MSKYTLYNTKLERTLNHPKIGLWSTPFLNIAKQALEECHIHLASVGLIHWKDRFVVLDLETNEII